MKFVVNQIIKLNVNYKLIRTIMGGGDGDTFLKKSKDSVNFHKYEDFISG